MSRFALAPTLFHSPERYRKAYAPVRYPKRRRLARLPLEWGYFSFVFLTLALLSSASTRENQVSLADPNPSPVRQAYVRVTDCMGPQWPWSGGEDRFWCTDPGGSSREIAFGDSLHPSPIRPYPGLPQSRLAPGDRRQPWLNRNEFGSLGEIRLFSKESRWNAE